MNKAGSVYLLRFHLETFEIKIDEKYYVKWGRYSIERKKWHETFLFRAVLRLHSKRTSVAFLEGKYISGRICYSITHFQGFTWYVFMIISRHCKHSCDFWNLRWYCSYFNDSTHFKTCWTSGCYRKCFQFFCFE